VTVHHPDCDGFLMHSVQAVRTEHGTYKAECPLCGILPMIGSSGSPETAVAIHGFHSRSEPCDGRCKEWT
jgi:hypothetical protein